MVKNPPTSAGNDGLIPELERSHREGNGNLVQHCCLGNFMDGGAWWATVHGVAKSRTRLSDFTQEIFFGTFSRQKEEKVAEDEMVR